MSYSNPIPRHEHSHGSHASSSVVENGLLKLSVGSNVSPNIFKVLFCGIEFPSAFELTSNFLKDDPDIQLEFLARSEIPDKIGSFDFIVPRMSKLDKETIARAKKAKLICQFGVGLEGVDILAASEANIKVARIASSTNRFNSISCAEHCIYLMLSLLRKQRVMAESVANQTLGQPLGDTLWGKTVLIVGFGAIGEELSARLKPFHVRVLGVRRSWGKGLPSDGEDESIDEKGGPEDLLSFVSRADMVVMCALLTDETRGMVNGEFYSHMKENAMLVNIGRGGLLDYEATKQALESGKLKGLGTDVAWTEPIDPLDPVASHPCTIVTPHVGGVTEVSYTRMAHVMSETIRQVKAGEELTHVQVVN